MATYTTFDATFERFHYPAGESHLALRCNSSDMDPDVVVEARVTSFETLGEVLTAHRVLRHNGVRAEWFLPYFPFARHDRRNHAGDGFELGLALDLVRDLNLVIADPHSDVAGQLRHIPQTDCVGAYRKAGAFDNDPIVIVPDAGATKKAHEWAPGDMVQALKHRDPATGRLSGFEVLADDLHGRPCIIVDDICDGGGTFLGLAQALAAKNAGPLTLAVTHGLFTKGVTALAAAFERIFTFSYLDVPGEHASVTYLPFHDLYMQGAHR